jgi:PAS domain S-box-containing protein
LESLSELLNRITRNMKKILTAKREVTEQLQRESSELKLTQGLLAAEGQRFAVTLNLIDNGVVAADEKGGVTVINQAAARLTGWVQEEAVGKPLDQVCHIVNLQTGERCNNLTQRVMDTAGMLGFAESTALVARDGTETRIASAGAPIRDSEDNVVGLVLILRDLERQENPS